MTIVPEAKPGEPGAAEGSRTIPIAKPCFTACSIKAMRSCAAELVARQEAQPLVQELGADGLEHLARGSLGQDLGCGRLGPGVGMSVEPGELDVDDQAVPGEVLCQGSGGRGSRLARVGRRRRLLLGPQARRRSHRRQHSEAEEPMAPGSAGRDPGREHIPTRIVRTKRSLSHGCGPLAVSKVSGSNPTPVVHASRFDHPRPPALRGPTTSAIFPSDSPVIVRAGGPRANNLPAAGARTRGPSQYRRLRVESLPEGRSTGDDGPRSRGGGRGRPGTFPRAGQSAVRNLAGVDGDVDDGTVR